MRGQGRMTLLLLRLSYRVVPPRTSRAFHLLHHMFTKHPIGYLSAVKKHPLPPADGLSFRLLDVDGSDLGNVSLKDALARVRPGTHLNRPYPQKGGSTFQVAPVTIPSSPPSLSKGEKEFKRKLPTNVKEFHLSVNPPSSHLESVIGKCYEFIWEGERIEMGLHQRRQDPEYMTIDWALRTQPHLRPDTILKAMPEGTQMIAHPCTAPDLVKAKRPKAAAPLQWAMEYEPFSQRMYGKPPTWMKQMGTWDVELQLDPHKDKTQSVKHMYRYSVRLHEERERQKTSQGGFDVDQSPA